MLQKPSPVSVGVTVRFWKTARLDTTIDVVNEKSGFIQSGELFSTSLWSHLNISEPTLDVIGNDAWSVEAYE
ncbi:hypothetical protein TNCV_4398291 [Trichonephila clavipes]|nr:hypothetical protein TNCV_4398291 [Trichonephila clavipes]